MRQRLHLVVAKVAAVHHIIDRNEWCFPTFSLDAVTGVLSQPLYEAQSQAKGWAVRGSLNRVTA